VNLEFTTAFKIEICKCNSLVKKNLLIKIRIFEDFDLIAATCGVTVWKEKKDHNDKEF